MTNFAETTIEQATIDWLKDLGYSRAFYPEIAFGGVGAGEPPRYAPAEVDEGRGEGKAMKDQNNSQFRQDILTRSVNRDESKL
jgi:hypothetical protein